MWPCRYKDYVKTMTSRVNTINGRTYCQDPTIFAWDLLNEARCQGCPPHTISVRPIWLHAQLFDLKAPFLSSQMPEEERHEQNFALIPTKGSVKEQLL